MIYNKPPLSIDKQIQLLKERGLIIDDVQKAGSYLLNISYYRLSAYYLPFQVKHHSGHKYNDGVTFDEVLNLYLFDRELRLLVFDIIERVEIAFRTQIIYRYSSAHGAWWYEDPGFYSNNYFYSKNLAKIDEEIDRSNEVFIEHFRNKYSSPERPPAWMTFEVISMGLLSKMYKNPAMTSSKKEIAKHFKVPTPYVLESWMHSLTYVRNICAHHSRLWNRTLTLKPQLLKRSKNTWLSQTDINPNKLYAFLSCCLYLLKTINPNTRFAAHFKDLLAKYPHTNLNAMGFDRKWEEEKLWE